VRNLLINVGQLYTKKLGPKPGVVKNASIEGYYCIWFVQEPLKKIDLSKKVSWIIACEKISIELRRVEPQEKVSWIIVLFSHYGLFAWISLLT